MQFAGAEALAAASFGGCWSLFDLFVDHVPIFVSHQHVAHLSRRVLFAAFGLALGTSSEDGKRYQVQAILFVRADEFAADVLVEHDPPRSLAGLLPYLQIAASVAAISAFDPAIAQRLGINQKIACAAPVKVKHGNALHQIERLRLVILLFATSMNVIGVLANFGWQLLILYRLGLGKGGRT